MLHYNFNCHAYQTSLSEIQVDIKAPRCSRVPAY